MVSEGKVSLEELEKFWSLDDLARFIAVLNYQNEIKKAEQKKLESSKGKK